MSGPTRRLAAMAAVGLLMAGCGGSSEPGHLTISGSISGVTAAGVTLSLTGAANAWTTTDASGSYSFGALKDGTYRVTPSLGAYVFKPASIVVTVAGSNVGDQKFTSTNGLTLFAGAPSGVGNVDGIGSNARFHYPQSAAVDDSGNVYVADTINSTIRKITPSGAVTTFAGGAGQVGGADGAGAAARFNNPRGVALDGAGNVYVADTGNSTIRKITPAAMVTTLAGTALASGHADGTGAGASFNLPYGVAADRAGNVFVADTSNQTIRKITPAGVVTTFAGTPGQVGAGDGTGPAAYFNAPQGVAVDASGNVYVADTSNSAIRKITPAGAVTTLAGTAGVTGSADGTGAAARFDFPQGLAVDGTGNVRVADSYNHTIRTITAAGAVTTLAGTAGQYGSAAGTGADARFYYPTGVAAGASGDVYVADWGNHTIRQISSAGVVATLAGAAPSPGVADGTGASARFGNPQGVAADAFGAIYVADSGNSTIRKITPGGVVTTLAGTAGVAGSADGTGSSAGLNRSLGVAVDGSGTVYVADTGNCAIRKITPAGAVTTLAGTAGVCGSADGTGAAASFNWPYGVTVDASGNLFVADNCTIRKITPAGVVTTLAGTAGVAGDADGTGAAASFNWPQGVAVDGSGDVFVADTGNSTVRKVTPAGVVTTIAGISMQTGSADGAGATATFNGPKGIAVDASGNLYVADTWNAAIRKIAPAGDVSTIVGGFSRLGSAEGPMPAGLLAPPGVAFDPTTGHLFIVVPDAVMEAWLP